jgi:hypothetical protein
MITGIVTLYVCKRDSEWTVVQSNKKPASAGGYFRGGERGIRTLDTLASKPPFQGGAIGH